MKRNAATGLFLALLGAPAATQKLSVEFVDTAEIGSTAVDQHGNAFSVTGMSGVTWLGGSAYAVVLDNSDKVVYLDVELADDGSIDAVQVSGGLTLAGAGDGEGIAFTGPVRGSVFVAEEGGPSIAEYDLHDGSLLAQVAVPPVYTAPGHLAANFGFESMSFRADGEQLWTVNEEALTIDGPPASPQGGTVVRLQRFLMNGPLAESAKQYAYWTEPMHGGSITGGRSGLVDLVALPNGRLLALERSLAFDLGGGFFRNSIWRVKLSGATNVGVGELADGLAGASYEPAGKELLWSSQSDVGQNLEGLCLGPELSGGCRVLLGVVDDGDPFSTNSLVTLRLCGGLGPYAPCGGPCPDVSLTGNVPFPLGGVAQLDVQSPAPGAPILVLVAGDLGPTPFAGFAGFSQLALDGSSFALADPTGGMPGLGLPPTTDGTGNWSASIPVPVDPDLLSLELYAEAFVLDPLAPNGLYLQSDELAIAFE